MALFFIKLAHTLIFLAMSACVIYMLYSGIMRRLTRWTAIALLLTIVEGVVLILNDWRCPLTALAERLGAESGSVSDIFLPSWMADHVYTICVPLFALACFILIFRNPRS